MSNSAAVLVLKRRWIPVVAALLFCSCGKEKPSASASVKLLETQVKLGGQLHLRVDKAPAGWTGQVSVNNAKSFEIDAKGASPYGFPPLMDSHRTDTRISSCSCWIFRAGELVLPNNGRFRVNVIPPAIGILPDRYELSSRGGDGTDSNLQPRPDAAWTVTNNPVWVIGRRRFGRIRVSGSLSFRVAPNASAQERTGTLEIGDATLEIIQGGRVSVGLIPGAAGTATSKKTGR